MRTILTIMGIIVAGIGWVFGSPEADMLRAHYPHGVHKLQTDKGSEKITWDSEVLAGDGVKRETLTFANLDEFQAAFLKANLNQAAYIEIAGMWNHAEYPKTSETQNEALLRFLRGKGYQEAHYTNLKKYYNANGHHFVDAIRDDGKILWSSSRIEGDRVIGQKREFASVEEFKKAFREAKLDKQTQIEVHARSVKYEGATARALAILEFLRAEGFVSAGPVSD